ncbi:MAG: DUF3696 domain-containing protein [Candidatus Gastranaerophilales bacterium]|nr:DUF3696 domain-containing protein [Candidatus Gastranaerophilales bacterium]
MLKNIHIQNFKSFDDEQITLSNLTLLTGPNCSGKSSVIQALLLLAHNIDKKEQITNKQASPISSYKVSLGDFPEIRNRNKNAKEILIEANQNDENASTRISLNPEFGAIAETKVSNSLAEIFNSKNLKIHYLSANRIGVQDLYNKNINNFDKYGMLGEFAIDYLNSHRSEPLINNLIKDDNSPTLSTQVDYWLQYILNTNIETESIIGSDKIKTKFKINTGKKTSDYVRPKNIGSGLSYIISILIMCLSSKEDDILIIENPEIHLHPKAQSLLTEFFIFIANAGIQLIIETHSDHIFNGIRKGIYKKQIIKDKIAVNFFQIDDKTLNTIYTTIEFTDNGKVKNVPNGLFDQFDEDLNILLGIL